MTSVSELSTVWRAEEAYRNATRNFFQYEVQRLERDPAPVEGESPIVAHAKAVYRRLRELRAQAAAAGVTMGSGDNFGHPV